MRAIHLISLLQCLAYLPSASAWIYSWHSPNDTLLSFQDDKPLSCKSMDNPKKNVFNWEPQDGHWCMFVYSNPDCEEPSVGRTCKDYEWANHPSSQHILSFKVNNNTAAFSSTAAAAESTTEATSSSSATAATTTSPTSSASVTATNGPGSSGSKSSPSGGAIAGIVIGVLAAVAIAGLLIFFLCWRRRKNGTDPNSHARTESTSGMVELSQPDEEQQSPVSEKPMYKSQGLRELTGSTGVSEIGSETERYEIGTEKHQSIPERYELDGAQYNLDRKN